MARRRASNGVMEMTVSLKELAGLTGADAARELDPALKRLAKEIAQEARASTAFRDKTGSLRRSIRVRKAGDAYRVHAGGKDAPHAHLIEFGHAVVTRDGRTVGHAPARPFLRPARDKVMSRAEEIIRASLD